MNRLKRSPFSALLALFAFFVLLGAFQSQRVYAQGVLIDVDFSRPLPRPFPPMRPAPRPVSTPRPDSLAYKIQSLDIDAQIADSVANVNFTQTFKNETADTIEAAFVFPLPYDGAIDSMTLLVNGKEYAAKLLDAKEARETYETIVRKNRDPALLEWIGTGMFKTSVFPIPAGETCVVSITYTQLLRTQNGLTEFLFPLSCAKYSTKPVEKTSFRVAIKGDSELKNIYSPTCDIKVDRDDADKNSAVVKYELAGRVPSSNFRLFFDQADSDLTAKIQSYRPNADEDGYFMLLAAPKIANEESTPLPKSIVLTLDVSGSMTGTKIAQARDSLKYVLERLRDGDRFNIVLFNSSVTAYKQEMQVCNAETRADALAYVNSVRASGSTNIEDALKTSFALLTSDDSSNPKYLVFLSDGEPTARECNEMKLAQIAREENKNRARIFTFGVGNDVNSRLLDRFVTDSRGQGEYVRPDENIEDSVSKLYTRIESPVLTDVAFEFALKNDANAKYFTNLVYPSGTIDVFSGEQVVLVGRYSKSGDVKISANGKIADKPANYEFEGALVDKSIDSSYSYIERLWAARRVGEIVDQLDLKGHNKELMDELLQLAKKHGIVTPYTSFLADDGVALNDNNVNGRVVMSNMGALSNTNNAAGFSQRSLKQNYRSMNSLDQADSLASQALEAATMSGMSMGSGMGMGSGAASRSARTAMSGSMSSARRNSNSMSMAMSAAPVEPQVTPQLDAVQKIQKVGAKTFYLKNGMWIDADIDEDIEKNVKPIEIEQFSDKYFDLLAKHGQELAQYMTFSEPLTIFFKGKVYKIVAAK